MQRNKIPVLCTRPLGQQLLHSAEQNGFEIDIIPFIKTEALVSEELKTQIHDFSLQNITAVFTSMNAAEAVIKELNGIKPVWRIFCIGNTTRNTLVHYFGEESIVGDGNNASDLAYTIIGYDNCTEVIFFCGDQRRDELPDMLSRKKIHVEEVIVYKTIPVTHKISRRYDAILFFSPSAVTSFFSDNTIDQETIVFAIGETTAGTIKEYCENKIVIGEESGKQNLVNAMITYYSSQVQQKMINRS